MNEHLKKFKRKKKFHRIEDFRINLYTWGSFAQIIAPLVFNDLPKVTFWRSQQSKCYEMNIFFDGNTVRKIILDNFIGSE